MAMPPIRWADVWAPFSGYSGHVFRDRHSVPSTRGVGRPREAPQDSARICVVNSTLSDLARLCGFDASGDVNGAGKKVRFVASVGATDARWGKAF
jgi:hypothetical protein